MKETRSMWVVVVVVALSFVACGDDASSEGDEGDAGVVNGDAGTGACDELSYASFGQSFFSDYCVTCHGPQLAEKKIHLDTLAGVVAAKSKVRAEVKSGAMPPRGATAPSSAERSRLTQWLDCGAK